MRDLVGFQFGNLDDDKLDITYIKLIGTPDQIAAVCKLVDEFDESYEDALVLMESYGTIDQGSLAANDELMSYDSCEVSLADRPKAIEAITDWLEKQGLSWMRVAPPSWAI